MALAVKHAVLPNGETLAYRERPGTGPCLLLLHGNMGSSALWEPFMEHFGPGCHLIAVDLRGYGESTYHHPIETMKDFSEDLSLFVEQLGIDQVIVMGWSHGGGVAMQFAADDPERVLKLLLLSSMSTRGYPLVNSEQIRLETKEQIAADPGLRTTLQANIDQDEAYFGAALDVLVFANRQPDEETRKKYIAACLQQRNMVDAADAANRFNISAVSNGLTDGTGEIERIACPVYVLWGSKDMLTTSEMTQEIIEDFTSCGKPVEYISLDAGHSPLIDDLPGFVRIVRGILAVSF